MKIGLNFVQILRMSIHCFSSCCTKEAACNRGDKPEYLAVTNNSCDLCFVINLYLLIFIYFVQKINVFFDNPFSKEFVHHLNIEYVYMHISSVKLPGFTVNNNTFGGNAGGASCASPNQAHG